MLQDKQPDQKVGHHGVKEQGELLFPGPPGLLQHHAEESNGPGDQDIPDVEVIDGIETMMFCLVDFQNGYIYIAS